jgi:hypothetical protein
MTKNQKKKKVTFRDLGAYAILFLFLDAAFALIAIIGLPSWLPLLWVFAVVEAVTLGYLSLQATFNALPKGVQKELRKL